MSPKSKCLSLDQQKRSRGGRCVVDGVPGEEMGPGLAVN